eukprot:gene6412-9313_t
METHADDETIISCRADDLSFGMRSVRQKMTSKRSPKRHRKMNLVKLYSQTISVAAVALAEAAYGLLQM